MKIASCIIPEEPKPEEIESDLIENKYNAGSIVWAKRNTYLWWPAMVDDCPIKFRYYELKRNSIIPVSININRYLDTVFLFYDNKVFYKYTYLYLCKLNILH